MIKLKFLHIIAFILLVVGGLNWGLVGAFDFNLVEKIFGSMPTIETIVYVLVGLSAVYLAATHSKDCNACKSSGGNAM